MLWYYLPTSTAVTWVGSRLVAFMCLFVCFSTRYLKTNAGTITKLDIKMSYHKSWKPIYLGVKRLKVTRRKNIAGVGHGAVLSAGFFYSWSVILG